MARFVPAIPDPEAAWLFGLCGLLACLFGLCVACLLVCFVGFFVWFGCFVVVRLAALWSFGWLLVCFVCFVGFVCFLWFVCLFRLFACVVCLLCLLFALSACCVCLLSALSFAWFVCSVVVRLVVCLRVWFVGLFGSAVVVCLVTQEVMVDHGLVCAGNLRVVPDVATSRMCIGLGADVHRWCRCGQVSFR